MKISSLIKRLQEVQQKDGDIDVFIAIDYDDCGHNATMEGFLTGIYDYVYEHKQFGHRLLLSADPWMHYPSDEVGKRRVLKAYERVPDDR